jgi:LPXTG-motif cell wall-anchored protein
MASRRTSLSLRLAALAVCGLGATAAASGIATAALADAPGANGTVKIDFSPADASRANRPHVTCPFAVQFFNFDENQTADISIAAHPPSGMSSQIVATASDVPASPDGVFTTFTEADVNLAGLEEHPNQGFHLKLTATVTEDGKTFEKHKVFWLKCAKPTTPPTKPPTSPPTTPPTTPPTKAPTAPTTSPGVLPVTGTGNWLGGVAGLGLALLATGTGLMLVRRRQDNLGSTS